MRLLLFILLLAPLIASSSGVSEPEGFWSGPINSDTPTTINGGSVVHTQDLPRLLERAPIVINVTNEPKRPAGMSPDAPWLPLPEEVIPGSVWLPGAGMAEIAPETEALFRELLSKSTRGHLDHPILIYCHERCWLSWNAAKRAIGYGYRQVFWFPEGIEGWRAAGNKTSVAKPVTWSDVAD